jgi:hypothetical protein
VSRFSPGDYEAVGSESILPFEELLERVTVRGEKESVFVAAGGDLGLNDI